MEAPYYVTNDPNAFRVKVNNDTKDIKDWLNQNLSMLQWGKVIDWPGDSAIYCFRYEKDAILFALRWSGK